MYSHILYTRKNIDSLLVLLYISCDQLREDAAEDRNMSADFETLMTVVVKEIALVARHWVMFSSTW